MDMDIANQIITLSKDMEKHESIVVTTHITIEERNAIHCDYLEYIIFNKEKSIRLSISGFENNTQEAPLGAKVIDKVHHEISKDNLSLLHDICFEYFKELVRDILGIFDSRHSPFIAVTMENDVTTKDVCIFGDTQVITKLWNNHIRDEEYLEMSEKGYERLFKNVWKYINLTTTITSVETKTKTDADQDDVEVELATVTDVDTDDDTDA